MHATPVPRRRPTARARLLRWLGPTELLISSFAGAILLGSGALMLPGATTAPLRFIDALFTATSAVCVTGLAVVDTGTFFTRQGQVTILALIQMGGLGIMTFSVILVLVTGRRISIRDKTIVQESFIPRASHDTFALVKLVFASSFLIEGIGFVLLLLSLPDHDVFSALFHAISAFCNAGFSLYSTSMVGFRYNPGVNLTICGLIILGGLGFFTHLDLRRRFRRLPGFRVSLHTRIVVLVTLILIVLGAVGFYLFESRNTLKDESLGGIVLLSIFQSVTARTAGFNTIDIGSLTNATLFMIILLMFVGASPGSTGGGIKTSTVGILFGMARSRIGGRESVHLFYRSVPSATVARALSVLVLGFTIVTFAVLLVALVEMGSQPYGRSDKQFVEIFFEVVSAFGTVGLSTGITPRLSDLGKFILVLVMFVGRVGPLTMAAVVGREQARGKFRYAEEDVMVG